MTHKDTDRRGDRWWSGLSLVVGLSILLSAGYLRLAGLGEPSLWFDEILHVQKTEETLEEPWYAWVTGLSVDRENGPLYYATQLLALRVSPSETAARLMPALFGIATVALLLAVTLVGTRNRRTALVAAALLALSPLHVYYSREARPYAAVMFMATLLLGLLVVRRRRWTVPVAWAACIATAYLGAIAAPVLLSFTLISTLAWLPGRRAGPSWSRHFAGAGLCGLGIGVLLFSSVEQISSSAAPSEMIVTHPLSRVAVDRLLGSLTVSGVEWASADLRSYGMLALALLGAVLLTRTDRWRCLATVGMGIFPIASWLLLLVVLHRWYNVRYTSAGLPALILLVAVGTTGLVDTLWNRVSHAATRRRFSWLPALSTLALTLVVVAPNWRIARTEPLEKPDWRGFAEMIGTLATGDEPVVTHGWWAETCLRHYLNQGGYRREVLNSGRNLAEARRLTADDRPAWLAAAGFVRGDEFRSWMHTTDPIVRSPRANIEIYYHPGFTRFLTDPYRTEALARTLQTSGEPAQRREFGASELMLGGGWSYPEIAGDGTTFRWAAADVSEAGILRSSTTDSTLHLRMLPFPSPDLPSQTVEIRLNSHSLGVVALDPGWNEYTVAAPAALWKLGGNHLEFQFAWLQSPAELDPSSPDSRRLAAAFDFVELVR